MFEPAKPLISAAIADAPSVAALICLGLGAPWPCTAVSRPLPTPSGFRCVVSELSRDCMTRPMMVRSDQRRLDRERAIRVGWFTALTSQPATRDDFSAYGTCRMERPPIAFEPLP